VKKGRFGARITDGEDTAIGWAVAGFLARLWHMESGISFGELEHAQPEKGLRPDQDRHFVVATCGEICEEDLPIFVDLDVFREMEAHAQTNTRVELGGVMLGQQRVDQDGKPFVVITDSLRARHYEATKGSFKFTHDTWSQITRERNEFRQDLEMVGWYHTHPGWGIFLSGMDLFICNNFFNRPLDVALVIDPCAGQRGWFQWDNRNSRKTQETSGFMLMTNRFRQNELNYFLRLYDNQQQTVFDPRYSQASFSQSGFPEAEQEMVHITDNRRPIIDLAILAMLFLQFLLAGLIAWRMTAPPGIAGNELTQRIAAIEQRLEERIDTERRSSREQTYSEILETIVANDTNQNGLVEKFAQLADENQSLGQNLAGQVARAELAILQRDTVENKFNTEAARSADLAKQLASAKAIIREADEKYQQLEMQLADNHASKTSSDNKSLLGNWNWLAYSGGGLLLTLLGAFGGYLIAGNWRNDVDDGTDSERASENEMELAVSRNDWTSELAASKSDCSTSPQQQRSDSSMNKPKDNRLSLDE
jgi:proteasome lid subunit RPN8/RPN11